MTRQLLPEWTTRTVGRLLTLLVISSLAALFRVLGPVPGIAGSTMLLGFLLLGAYVAGELAREFALPRITGYLVIGLLLGPDVLQLLPRDTVRDFRLINGVALSVIALQAGGELRVARLRPRAKGIAAITVAQIVVVSLIVSGVVFFGYRLLPFLTGQPSRAVLAAALIFGLVAVANSPATIIAVMTELRAHGRLTDTVLGVSVLKDVVVLLLIAVIVPAAAVLADPAQAFNFAELREIVFVILLSIALGVGLGWLIGLYIDRIGRQPILFILFVAFGVVELADVLGLESETYILISMAAGFVVQNLTVQGLRFLEALEGNSLFIYALFFAVAGADMNLAELPAVWRAGLVLIAARLVGIVASTYLGSRAAGEPGVIRELAWMGYIAQAGVTLGLAGIVRERLPEWGTSLAAIIVAMVAINQFVGPPLFRLSLVRADEANQAAGRSVTGAAVA
jgi:Kef-type K+ transport system membrane component KefB